MINAINSAIETNTVKTYTCGSSHGVVYTVNGQRCSTLIKIAKPINDQIIDAVNSRSDMLAKEVVRVNAALSIRKELNRCGLSQERISLLVATANTLAQSIDRLGQYGQHRRFVNRSDYR